MALIIVASTHNPHSPTSDNLATESGLETLELVSLIPECFIQILAERGGKDGRPFNMKGTYYLTNSFHTELSLLVRQCLKSNDKSEHTQLEVLFCPPGWTCFCR